MTKTDWTPDELEMYFRDTFEECIKLMIMKNHDYGNSWAADRDTTITDTTRHKLDRIRNIEDLRNHGDTPRVSEGIEQELKDIINYCVFRIIKEREYQDNH